MKIPREAQISTCEVIKSAHDETIHVKAHRHTMSFSSFHLCRHLFNAKFIPKKSRDLRTTSVNSPPICNPEVHICMKNRGICRKNLADTTETSYICNRTKTTTEHLESTYIIEDEPYLPCPCQPGLHQRPTLLATYRNLLHPPPCRHQARKRHGG